jgi:hypothetical protein
MVLRGADGPNFSIIRGEPEALMAFTSAQETMVANMKAALINEGFQWPLRDWGCCRGDDGTLRTNGGAV